MRTRSAPAAPASPQLAKAEVLLKAVVTQASHAVIEMEQGNCRDGYVLYSNAQTDFTRAMCPLPASETPSNYDVAVKALSLAATNLGERCELVPKKRGGK